MITVQPSLVFDLREGVDATMYLQASNSDDSVKTQVKFEIVVCGSEVYVVNPIHNVLNVKEYQTEETIANPAKTYDLSFLYAMSSAV